MSGATSLLIVEGNAQMRELLAAYLTAEYDCSEAASSEEAANPLTGSVFDLALVDVELPGASGLEFCGLIRAECPDTGVIVDVGVAQSPIQG